VDAATAVGARAYTIGQDIHFNAGQYDPGSQTGQHLLAHEVAHTVQQAGSAPSRQYKLEVSQPGDGLEVAADTAADAMVAGRPAFDLLGAATPGVSRKVFREVDPGYGTLAGAGDEAAAEAMKKPLSVDTVSVTKDKSDVASTIEDIKTHGKVIETASDTDLPNKQMYVATNTAAIAKLGIFTDKLDVSTVDTAAFAMQYRFAFSDFQRLTAEAHEILAHAGVKTGDEVGAATEGISNTSLKLDASVQLSEFKAARTNLNTAATKMGAKLTAARGAANGLQAAIYKAQAKAAEAKEKEDQEKLAAVKAEIAAVAGGVGKVVKLVTTVAGFAGGGSATSAALGTVKEPGSVTIEGADVGSLKGTSLGNMLEKKQDVDLDPEGRSKKAILKAMYGDAGKLDQTGSAILSGDPSKMAEALVTAIGEYANKSKMEKLQTSITKAAAEVKVFSAAGEALDMIGKQDTLKSASDELSIEVKAFAFAKKDLAEKQDALMALLARGGKKGSNQAKVVLFLGDADRFLAQVQNAISVGENQQANMKQAAEDRKALRGTAAFEDGTDRDTQHYYRGQKLGKKPWHHHGEFYYQITRMDVKFTAHDNMLDPNFANQGGAGTVEGAGGADDAVATKIKTLKDAQAKVQKLQKACQDALFGAGKGEAGING
jgi:hypothetical protein